MFRFKKNIAENSPVRYAKIYNFTFSQISFAAFLIAVISGIFLAIPFDIKNPFDSLSYMLLTNPGGVFFRNIHYWSAQLFLIFAILHIYDHLKKSTEKEVKSGVWIRLTFSLIVIFFVMVSGFIIKADADSIDAKQIITSLINLIPFTGKELSTSILGSGNDYQVLYVHHIATATVILFIIIIEHAKTIWPKLKLVLFILPVLISIGYLFPPALHDKSSQLIKGPWYFLGLQEILHWLSYPAIILILILLYLLGFAFVPKYSNRYAVIFKKIVFVSFIIYLLLIIIGFFFRGEDWKFMMPWKNHVLTVFHFEPFDNISSISSNDIEKRNIPIVLGRREGCLYCHQNMKGFSPAHNPQAIGCVSCHSGSPFTLNKTYAHKGMFLIPGNLDEAKQSCGSSNCHNDITDRVNNTIMTTLTGMISVDRYAFGETKDLNKLHFISRIDHSPADNHLRNLCASCHLGGQKTEPGPITQLSRGGGCNACHLNYDSDALKTLARYKESSSSINDSSYFHPSLSIKITKDHCFKTR
jgi:Cytochrome b/b6/petB